MNSTDDNDETCRCGTFFYAQCTPGRPETFRLECCQCGRLWWENPDGSLEPVADDPEQAVRQPPA